MSLEPVTPFTTLCLSCFEPDKVTMASTGEATIYVCGACGAMAKAAPGELPRVVYE